MTGIPLRVSKLRRALDSIRNHPSNFRTLFILMTCAGLSSSLGGVSFSLNFLSPHFFLAFCAIPMPSRFCGPARPTVFRNSPIRGKVLIGARDFQGVSCRPLKMSQRKNLHGRRILKRVCLCHDPAPQAQKIFPSSIGSGPIIFERVDRGAGASFS